MKEGGGLMVIKNKHGCSLRTDCEGMRRGCRRGAACEPVAVFEARDGGVCGRRVVGRAKGYLGRRRTGWVLGESGPGGQRRHSRQAGAAWVFGWCAWGDGAPTCRMGGRKKTGFWVRRILEISQKRYILESWI